MNLILFKRSEISDDGKSVQLDSKDPRTKHIFDHLKKYDGDTVTAGIISGRQGSAIVRYYVGDGCQRRLDFEFDTSVVIDHSSSKCVNHEIVLVLSMPFPKRLKNLWPQISSMGVARVCVVRGSLSDSSFAQSSSITPKVYRPLIEEGMSQGCHTKEVTVDIEVEDVLSRAVLDKLGLTMSGSTSSQLPCTTSDIKIVLDCGDEASSPPLPLHRVVMKNISDVATTTLESSNCVVLAIGSERGWTEDEARLFQEAGFHAASLGKSILRVDTAVVAGLGIVSTILDEQEVARNTNLMSNLSPDDSAKTMMTNVSKMVESLSTVVNSLANMAQATANTNETIKQMMIQQVETNKQMMMQQTTTINNFMMLMTRNEERRQEVPIREIQPIVDLQQNSTPSSTITNSQYSQSQEQPQQKIQSSKIDSSQKRKHDT